VLTDARRLVTPSKAEEEKLARVAKSLLGQTRQAASKYPETKGVLLGGSYAKGTWLPGLFDLDIFVRLDASIPDDRFERIGLEVGASATKGYPQGKKYAQHPYTEAKLEGIRVNIVPCFAVKKGMWRSAADRSPFHVRLVKGLPTEKKRQVRLLKKFMDGVGVYGAEIRTRGFSGYVAEVLVMKFGSLDSVLKWIASYSLQVGRQNPFSLPDPVDETRDLGMAVSGESLGRLVLASRGFLRRPGLGYFTKIIGKARPSLQSEVVVVKFSHDQLSEDTLWGELRKTCRHIVKHLEVKGFVIARSISASDDRNDSAFILIPEFAELPPVGQRVGPTVDRRKDVEAFIATNSKRSRLTWVDDDARVRLLMPREHTRLVDLLEEIVKGKAGQIGASDELEEGMKRSGKVLHGAPLARAASKAKWLQNGIREITTDAIGTSER
jgi:tRNA nucleotidyltransferase (CCA-adding enzyme)